MTFDTPALTSIFVKACCDISASARSLPSSSAPPVSSVFTGITDRVKEASGVEGPVGPVEPFDPSAPSSPSEPG